MHWPGIGDGDFALVYFLTSSADRVANICKHIRGKDGSQYFRFATHADAFDPHKVLTDSIWSTVTGESKAILGTHVPA